MANKSYIPKRKMPISERAKQFAPFSSLSGLSRALRLQEQICVPKPTLCDDQIAYLDNRLHELTPGLEIEILFYREGQVRRFTGRVTQIEPRERKIFVGQQEIPFAELLDIRISLSKNSGEEDFYSDEQ